MRKIRDTPYYSKLVGRLPEGCRLCVRGAKLVLFVTGLCPGRCFYCPLSERRRWKDVTVANEWWIRRPKDIVEEARLCDAEGAGLTGGDPLMRLDRTVKYIRLLKNSFGGDFHTHLYTSGALATDKTLRRLYRAGLDEIRFHPEKKDWGKIALALKYDWSVGCEIPAIPDEEEKAVEFVDYVSGLGVSFMNINEMEVSETNYHALSKLGLQISNDDSSAIAGSDVVAGRLLEYCARENDLSVHYCTVKLKDRVQVGRRIIRRARNVKKPFDIVDGEGILLRGAIYFPGLEPSFGYNRKLESLPVKERANTTSRLRRLRDSLQVEYGIPQNLIEVDGKRLRVLTASWVLEEISGDLKERGLKVALVWEYPTWDAFITELDFL
ncbi:MAG: radical SAM protein [Methanobacteriota archaeon]